MLNLQAFFFFFFTGCVCISKQEKKSIRDCIIYIRQKDVNDQHTQVENKK